MTADHITECLWAGEPPAGAFGTLQSYFSHLRRRLEPDVAVAVGRLARKGRGYAVQLSVDAVDAWTFERLLEPAAVDDAPVARLTEAL